MLLFLLRTGERESTREGEGGRKEEKGRKEGRKEGRKLSLIHI